MMISDNMKIAFVTSHVPLSAVPKLLTKEKNYRKIKKYKHDSYSRLWN